MREQTTCCKPEITYPCLWHYRLIGEDRQVLLAVIEATLAGRDCTVADGNTSSGGRYLSLDVKTTVGDEEDRLRLYQVFAGHPGVKVVL